MQNTYQVQRGKESLVARLVEDEERIELTYINARGDNQVGIYRNGFEVSTKATMVDGTSAFPDNKGNSFLGGYMEAYNRLGPELRAQIPSDWHVILGKWLAPK